MENILLTLEIHCVLSAVQELKYLFFKSHQFFKDRFCLFLWQRSEMGIDRQ